MMRPGHAVMLLGGWLLMTSPYDPKRRPEDIPITQWDHLAAYDTAAACEDDQGSSLRDDERQDRDAADAGLLRLSDLPMWNVGHRNRTYRCVPADAVYPKPTQK